MSDNDDIQLDEETLRQIEEEALREAEAQLEADDSLNQRLQEEALQAAGAQQAPKPVPAPVEPAPQEEFYDDDDSEDYEDDGEEFEDKEELEDDGYRAKSSIELLEVEMANKSGRLKVAIFIMIGVVILGAAGVVGIIMMNKKRAEDAANVEPIKIGPRGNSSKTGANNNKQARILLSNIRKLARDKRVVATRIEEGLSFVEKLRKEYPEFAKENAATIDDAETKLKNQQKALQEMMNMGK